LKVGDVVKISLGAHIDGFAGILADTLVVSGDEAGVVDGRKADVLMAGWLASEAAIRLVKPGNKNYAVTDAVAKIAEAFGCKPLEGGLSPLLIQGCYRINNPATISLGKRQLF
jgi:methionine aminopeptidase